MAVSVNTIFLCGVEQISFPKIVKAGARFANNYTISTDKDRLKYILERFGKSLGTVETEFLLHQSDGFVFRETAINIESDEIVGFGRELDNQLNKDMMAIKFLESEMWRVKDNCFYFDRAWITGVFRGHQVVNCNSWISRASCSDGSRASVEFSAEELRKARLSDRLSGVHLSGSGSPTMLTKESLRFQRFEYFIGAARAEADIPLKIAQYCSALEALVSNANQELSHQVAERVSSLIHPKGHHRISVYRNIKKAYGYRSRAVHGASFKDSEFESMRECSVSADEVCRKISNLYFSEENFQNAVESSSDALTEFFLERILGSEGAEP